MAMSAIMTKGSIPMEIKKLSISAKRQITIPQKFFTMLGFDKEAECTVRGNELIISKKKNSTGGDFAEQILADLIAEGYSGNDLLERFKKVQREIRPAVESMLVEAAQTASSESGYIGYEEVYEKSPVSKSKF